MTNLTFLACIACFSPDKINHFDSEVFLSKPTHNWTCNEFSWDHDSPSQTVVKVNAFNCNASRGSVSVIKTDGGHSHHLLSETNECEWKTMLILKNTSCKQIKQISINQ